MNPSEVIEVRSRPFLRVWAFLATGGFGIPTPDGVDRTTLIKGLFYGGGWDQLKAQFVGSLTAVIVVSAASIVLMWAVKGVKMLRVSKDGELEGLDIHEHGTPPYHTEFGQGMTYTTLLGTSPGFGETSSPLKTITSDRE